MSFVVVGLDLDLDLTIKIRNKQVNRLYRLGRGEQCQLI